MAKKVPAKRPAGKQPDDRAVEETRRIHANVLAASSDIPRDPATVAHLARVVAGERAADSAEARAFVPGRPMIFDRALVPEAARVERFLGTSLELEVLAEDAEMLSRVLAARVNAAFARAARDPSSLFALNAAMRASIRELSAAGDDGCIYMRHGDGRLSAEWALVWIESAFRAVDGVVGCLMHEQIRTGSPDSLEPFERAPRLIASRVAIELRNGDVYTLGDEGTMQEPFRELKDDAVAQRFAVDFVGAIDARWRRELAEIQDKLPSHELARHGITKRLPAPTLNALALAYEKAGAALASENWPSLSAFSSLLAKHEPSGPSARFLRAVEETAEYLEGIVCAPIQAKTPRVPPMTERT